MKQVTPSRTTQLLKGLSHLCVPAWVEGVSPWTLWTHFVFTFSVLKASVLVAGGSSRGWAKGLGARPAPHTHFYEWHNASRPRQRLGRGFHATLRCGQFPAPDGATVRGRFRKQHGCFAGTTHIAEFSPNSRNLFNRLDAGSRIGMRARSAGSPACVTEVASTARLTALWCW